MSSDESSSASDVKPANKAAAKKNADAKELKTKRKKRAPVESESEELDDIVPDSSGSDDGGQVSSKKKQKKAGVSKQQEKSSPAPKKSKQYVKSAEGENMVEFGPKRFAGVTEFKGTKMVNIREYYEKNGQLLPGKKGISMKLDQWKQFKSIIPDIDELIKRDGD